MPLTIYAALAALMALLLLLLPQTSLAQQPLTPEQAVEAGQRALSQSGRVPWYDRSKDDVRQLHVLPRDAADSKNRNSNWTKDQTLTPRGGIPRISFFGSALQWLGLSVLIVLLVVIAFLIAKAFLKEEISDDIVLRKVVESSRDADRVEALPFSVRKPTSDFLAEARRLYEAGDYSEAIIYLFSHELVQLDRQHLIRLTKGKTNRQYLRELRQRPHLRAILETTVINFEDAFFGRKTLTRERFERSWQQVDDFHRELERLERAAA